MKFHLFSNRPLIFIFFVTLLLCFLLPATSPVEAVPALTMEGHPLLTKRDNGTSREHFSGIKAFFRSIREKTSNFWAGIKAKFGRSSSGTSLRRRSFDEFAHNSREKMSYAFSTMRNGLKSWWGRVKSGSKRVWHKITGKGQHSEEAEESVSKLAKRDFYENVNKKADAISLATVKAAHQVKEGVVWGAKKVGEGLKKTPELAKKVWETTKCTLKGRLCGEEEDKQANGEDPEAEAPEAEEEKREQRKPQTEDINEKDE